MAKRSKFTLSLDTDLISDVDHACVDLDIERSDAAEEALRKWFAALKKVDGKYRRRSVDSREDAGEFIKCPAHLRDFATAMIIRLMESDPKMLPAVEELLVIFTRPGYIEDILSDNAKSAILGPRAVPNKK